MKSKRRLLSGSLLCAIIDRDMLGPRRLLHVARAALEGGADMLQLRGKRSSVAELVSSGLRLKKLAAHYGVPLVVNDRIDVAIAVDSDGVHVGQGDMAVRTARRSLGADRLVGLSVSTVREARRARALKVDYIGAGPVYATPVKTGRDALGLNMIERIADVGIPVIAIGGIDESNISCLTERGCRRVAVIRAVSLSRDVSAATRRLKGLLIHDTASSGKA